MRCFDTLKAVRIILATNQLPFTLKHKSRIRCDRGGDFPLFFEPFKGPGCPSMGRQDTKIVHHETVPCRDHIRSAESAEFCT